MIGDRINGVAIVCDKANPRRLGVVQGTRPYEMRHDGEPIARVAWFGGRTTWEEFATLYVVWTAKQMQWMNGAPDTVINAWERWLDDHAAFFSSDPNWYQDHQDQQQ